MEPPNDTMEPPDNVVTAIFGKGRGGKQSCLNTAKQPRWVDFTSKGEPAKDLVANMRAFLRHMGVKLWLNLFENRIRIDGGRGGSAFERPRAALAVGSSE